MNNVAKNINRFFILNLLALRRTLSNKNLIVVISILIGLLSGLAGVVLKKFVNFLEYVLLFWLNSEYANYPYFFYPFIGLLLTTIYIKLFHKGVFDKGLSNLIFILSKNKTEMPFHKMYSHIVTSAMTVGFGGSVGLEAPIVITGAAIGSSISRVLRLNLKNKTLLVGCGAAAGIASVFNSPIGGVIFVMEVLLTEFSIPAFIPLLIASASGAVISKLLMPESLFQFTLQGWEFKAIPFYFVFGAFCGIVSAYMVHFTKLVEKLFSKFNSSFRKVFIGALILGLMIFFFPPLYGEGFESLNDLFKGHYNHILEKSFFYQFKNHQITILLFVSSIMLLKVFASSITIGSGGNGGIIAPSLFTGALAGFVFSYSLQISGIIDLKTENFMAVGMAGLLSGVIHAPLTAIFLIAEGTNGYSLMVPLMIVSAMSFLVKRFINPHSIYIMSLVEEGKWNPDDKDKSVLEELNPADFIERDFLIIQPGIKLRNFVDKIAQSKRNLFPVCNKKGYLIGIVLLDDVREFMFTNEMYDAIIVSDLMHEPADYILTEDNFETIMKKFDGCNAWNLPVIDDKKYVGFISKSAIFNQYRNHLQHNSFYE